MLRVERWRREQKRKVMVEINEEVKDEKRRQRKAALEDRNNPWVEDDDSAEEAEIETVEVKKGDETKKMDDNEDEDPLDAYMSSLKNSLVGKSGVEIQKSQKTEKVSVVVATRVTQKGKGQARGELVEANQACDYTLLKD